MYRIASLFCKPLKVIAIMSTTLFHKLIINTIHITITLIPVSTSGVNYVSVYCHFNTMQLLIQRNEVKYKGSSFEAKREAKLFRFMINLTEIGERGSYNLLLTKCTTVAEGAICDLFTQKRLQCTATNLKNENQYQLSLQQQKKRRVRLVQSDEI